jgi:hypothetical protein
MAARLAHQQSPGRLAVYSYRKKKKKKRKRSRELKGLERAVRRTAMASSSFSNRYLKAHRKSTRKKKDGWLRDLDDNLYKASKKGNKKLKLRRILNVW